MRASIRVMRAPSSEADNRDAAASPAAPAPAITMRADVLSLSLASACVGRAVLAAPAATRLRKRRRSVSVTTAFREESVSTLVSFFVSIEDGYKGVTRLLY